MHAFLMFDATQWRVSASDIWNAQHNILFQFLAQENHEMYL
jgi:hypothetical protein